MHRLYGELPEGSTPSAIPIEKSVLASCLLMSECAEEVVESLDNQCFYRTSHKIYFDGIEHLVSSGAPVNLAGVAQYIHDKKLTASAPASELSDLTNEPISVNLQYNISKLREKAALRRVIEVCHAGMKRAQDSAADPYETVDYLKAEFGKLEIDNDAEENVGHSADMAMDASDRYDKLSTGEIEIGIKTGFADIDNMIIGLKPSDEIIIAGRPSMGKTAFAMNICEKSNEPVFMFSLEQSKEQLFDRLVSMKSSVDLGRITQGLFTPKEWDVVTDMIGHLHGRDIHIDDSPGLTMGQIRSRARNAIKKYGIKLFIIDYIQLVRADLRKDGNRNLEVGKVVQEIKNIAKEFKVPFIGISQLSRDLERRPNPHKIPKLSDLRDSGEIEQVADVVMFVYRPEVYNDLENMVTIDGQLFHAQASVYVAKQRQGATGKAVLRFEKECVRFDNVSYYNEGDR